MDALLCKDEEGNPIAQPRTFSRGLEVHGLCVADAAGGGKTHLIRNCLMKHPAIGPGIDGPERFLQVTSPSPATLKSLGCEILRVSGYPEVSERRERWSIWNILRNRLTALDKIVLWVDEAHDLISTKNEVRDLLKTLKRLMQGDQGIIVVLSGTDLLLDLIYFDDEVERRFTKIQLPSVIDATEGDALRAVIKSFCEIAGLNPPVENDLVPRLIHGCRGRFGLCIERIIEAIGQALKYGDQRLSLMNFSDAWNARESRSPDLNVFANDNWASIDVTAGRVRKLEALLK